MASYRNPYASQSTQIRSIADNLADAFLPNSAAATGANLYNMRAQRYADLARKSQLDADKIRLENQKTRFEADQARRLRNAFSPNIAGIFGLDPNDPNTAQTASDLAGLLQTTKDLCQPFLPTECVQGKRVACRLRNLTTLDDWVSWCKARLPVWTLLRPKAVLT